MILYLVRHAIAEEARSGLKDEDRALTAEGIAKFHRAARGMVRIMGEGGPRIIWTSPLVRARQTAELLAESLHETKVRSDVQTSEHLAPPGNLSRFLKEARGHAAPAIAAVGHEPILSDWLGRICFGTHGRAQLKKGGLAIIELDDAGTRGELLALLQPGTLRDIR